MSLDVFKTKTIEFFESSLKPLLLENDIEGCLDIIKNKKNSDDWLIKRYGNTIRVSTWECGLGYLMFMVVTPDGLEEYDFGVKYYGSRG